MSEQTKAKGGAIAFLGIVALLFASMGIANAMSKSAKKVKAADKNPKTSDKNKSSATKREIEKVTMPIGMSEMSVQQRKHLDAFRQPADTENYNPNFFEVVGPDRLTEIRTWRGFSGDGQTKKRYFDDMWENDGL